MIYKVRAHSGERQYQCIKKNEDTFVIYVKEKAKEGGANEAVIRVFCEYLHTSKNLVGL